MKKQKPDRLQTDCIWLLLKEALDESRIKNLKDFVGEKTFEIKHLNGVNKAKIRIPKSHARLVRIRLDNWKVAWTNG